MITLARKYLDAFGTGSIDIETIAVQKDQDFENETTYWIFKDGSAIYKNSSQEIGVKNDYGLYCDHEQLR